MFDSIGEIDREVTKDFTNAQRESLQYISFTSIQAKMKNLFGIKNEFFGKMFFNFLSDRKPLNFKINFQIFVEKLMPFWLKNAEDMMLVEDQKEVEIWLNKEKKIRNLEIHQLIFDMLNLSG